MDTDLVKNIIKTALEIVVMIACIILIILGIPDYTRADWGILAAIALYGTTMKR